MGRSAKICSVKRNYGNEFSLEGSLAKAGYNRFPGTGIRMVPYKEVNGSFRTGLDPDAVYINRMAPKEQEIERARVTKLKEELEAMSGLDLSPKSLYYTDMFHFQEFGTNSRARLVKLVDGDNIFNLENVFDAITFAWLRVHPQIAPSWETYRAGRAGNVQFYVSDPEVENEIIFNEKIEINKAIAALNTLSDEKALKLARLLGLPVSDSSKRNVVYNLLDNFIKSNDIKVGEFRGQKPLRVFNELLSMKDDNLYLKDLIEQGFLHGIYRTKNGRIMEGQQEVAKSKSDLVDRLLTPKFQDDVLALEEKIKAKKSILQ